MKAPVILVALITAGLLPSCASKSDSDGTQTTPEVKAGTEGTASAKAALEAQMGGQLVTVGDHVVEVRLMKRGLVEALVLDARGQAIAEPSKAEVTAHAATAGGARQAIKLAWEPTTARFVGRADADAELEPGPVEVELKLGDANARGKLETAVLLVGPEAGGSLVVAGKHGVELLVGARGQIEALVRDAAGVRVTGDADAKLEAKLTGADAKLHAVTLAWSPARARFVGTLEAGVTLAPGPAELSVNGEAAVKLPRLALRAEAKHGGRLILAGDYSVELVVNGDVVSAYAFDASGAAHVKGDLELALRAGTGAFVKLVWDAPSLSYRAKLDAKLDLDVEPLVLSVKANGKAFVGAYAKADAKLDAKANVHAKADAKAHANGKANVGAKLNVKPPSVKVSPPKVDVKVDKKAGASAKGGFSFGTK